ncbi:Neurotrophin 1 [Carabus blaptoides fortunei]
MYLKLLCVTFLILGLFKNAAFEDDLSDFEFDSADVNNTDEYPNDLEDYDEEEEEVERPSVSRETLVREIILNSMKSDDMKEKVARVLPILRVMTPDQKLALASLVTSQVLAPATSKGLTLDEVSILFGNNPNVTAELMLPISLDVANMFRTARSDTAPMAEELKAPYKRPAGVHRRNVLDRTHTKYFRIRKPIKMSNSKDAPNCELFTSSICLKSHDYPIDAIISSIRRNKHAMAALLTDFAVLPTDGSVDDMSTEPEYKHTLDEETSNEVRRTGAESGYMCPSVIRYARPQKARATSGQWKYIVNTVDHTQTLRLERCMKSGDTCTYLTDNFKSRCVQVYNYHRLLTWDQPNGLHMDIFKVPTCCSCHIDSYKIPFPPHPANHATTSEYFPGEDLAPSSAAPVEHYQYPNTIPGSKHHEEPTLDYADASYHQESTKVRPAIVKSEHHITLPKYLEAPRPHQPPLKANFNVNYKRSNTPKRPSRPLRRRPTKPIRDLAQNFFKPDQIESRMDIGITGESDWRPVTSMLLETKTRKYLQKPYAENVALAKKSGNVEGTDEHPDAISEHEIPRDVPTKPIYPGEGKWSDHRLRHTPYIANNKDLPQPKELVSARRPEGYDTFEQGEEQFHQAQNKFHHDSDRFPTNHNLNPSSNEDDTELEPLQENPEIEFVPQKLYAQVRKTESEQHLPKSAIDPEEEENAARLREVIKDSKVHTVYTEEGYEDSAYDHAGHEKHAENSEGHAQSAEDEEAKSADERKGSARSKYSGRRRNGRGRNNETRKERNKETDTDAQYDELVKYKKFAKTDTDSASSDVESQRVDVKLDELPIKNMQKVTLQMGDKESIDMEIHTEVKYVPGAPLKKHKFVKIIPSYKKHTVEPKTEGSVQKSLKRVKRYNKDDLSKRYVRKRPNYYWKKVKTSTTERPLLNMRRKFEAALKNHNSRITTERLLNENSTPESRITASTISGTTMTSTSTTPIPPATPPIEDLLETGKRPKPNSLKVKLKKYIVKRQKRFTIDHPNVDVDLKEFVDVKALPNPTVKPDLTFVKYPYYKSPVTDTMNIYSPLRYAEDMANIPRKTNDLSFYESRSHILCPQIESNVDPIPDRITEQQNEEAEEDKDEDVFSTTTLNPIHRKSDAVLRPPYTLREMLNRNMKKIKPKNIYDQITILEQENDKSPVMADKVMPLREKFLVIYDQEDQGTTEHALEKQIKMIQPAINGYKSPKVSDIISNLTLYSQHTERPDVVNLLAVPSKPTVSSQIVQEHDDPMMSTLAPKFRKISVRKPVQNARKISQRKRQRTTIKPDITTNRSSEIPEESEQPRPTQAAMIGLTTESSLSIKHPYVQMTRRSSLPYIFDISRFLPKIPNHKIITSEVHYKDEIKPSEQMRMYTDVLKTINDELSSVQPNNVTFATATEQESAGSNVHDDKVIQDKEKNVKFSSTKAIIHNDRISQASAKIVDLVPPSNGLPYRTMIGNPEYLQPTFNLQTAQSINNHYVLGLKPPSAKNIYRPIIKRQNTQPLKEAKRQMVNGKDHNSTPVVQMGSGRWKRDTSGQDLDDLIAEESRTYEVTPSRKPKVYTEIVRAKAAITKKEDDDDLEDLNPRKRVYELKPTNSVTTENTINFEELIEDELETQTEVPTTSEPIIYPVEANSDDPNLAQYVFLIDRLHEKWEKENPPTETVSESTTQDSKAPEAIQTVAESINVPAGEPVFLQIINQLHNVREDDVKQNPPSTTAAVSAAVEEPTSSDPVKNSNPYVQESVVPESFMTELSSMQDKLDPERSSDGAARLRNFSAKFKTSIDTSKYQTIERNPVSFRHNLSSRYNAEDQELPLGRVHTTQLPTVSTTRSDIPTRQPTTEEVTLAKETTTAKAYTEVTTARPRKPLRSRNRSSTTPKPTSTTSFRRRRPTRVTTEATIVTTKSDTHSQSRRRSRFRPESQNRYTTTAPVTAVADTTDTAEDTKKQRRLQTIHERRVVSEVTLTRFYEPDSDESAGSSSNENVEESKRHQYQIAGPVTSATELYTDPELAKHVNQLKDEQTSTESSVTHEDIVGTTSANGIGTLYPNMARMINRLADSMASLNVDASGEDDAEDKPLFIKDPSKRMYYYARL